MIYISKLHRFSSAALVVGALTISSHAQATILAAWDVWADSGLDGVYDADSTFTGFSSSIASQAGRINVGWSSTDGTYGNVPGAPTVADGAFLTRDTGGALTMTYTLTNNSGSDYSIDSFNFDFAPRGDGGTTESFGPNAFTLTYTSGGLSPTDTLIASESGLTYILSGAADGDPNAKSNYPDYSFSLSPSLSNIVLADGQFAVFTLVFSGSSGSNSANVSSVVDNVAFVGSSIPEPGAYAAMLGLASVALVFIRRKRQLK